MGIERRPIGLPMKSIRKALYDMAMDGAFGPGQSGEVDLTMTIMNRV